VAVEGEGREVPGGPQLTCYLHRVSQGLWDVSGSVTDVGYKIKEFSGELGRKTVGQVVGVIEVHEQISSAEFVPS